MGISKSKNLFYTGIANGSSIFLLLLLVLLARFLGKDDYGRFSYVFAVLSAFSLIADFGLTELTRREIARNRASAGRLISSTLFWRSILALGAYMAGAVFFFMSVDAEQLLPLGLVLGVAIFLKALKQVTAASLQGLEAFGAFALSQLIHNLGIVLVGALALFMGANLMQFCVFFAMYKIVDLMFALWLTSKSSVGSLTTRPSFALAWDLQRIALPVGVLGVIDQANNYADTIILGLLRDPGEVGLYSSAYQIFIGYTVLPTIVSQAYAASLVRAFDISAENGMAIMREAVAWVLLAGLGPLVFLWHAAPFVVDVLYGQDFSDASGSLRWLMGASVFVGVNWIFGLAAISANRQFMLVPIMGFALLFNILLNLMLIPNYGHEGAAFATFASAGLISFLLMLRIKAILGPPRITWLVASGVFIWVCAWASGYFVPNTHSLITGFVAGGVGIVLATSIGWFLRTYPKTCYF